jgi:hypothetical protein
MGPVMIIEVKLAYPLRRNIEGYSKKGPADYKWDLPEGTIVEDVLEIMNLSNRGTLIFLIKGDQATRKSILHDGDVLHIYPLMTGG